MLLDEINKVLSRAGLHSGTDYKVFIREISGDPEDSNYCMIRPTGEAYRQRLNVLTTMRVGLREAGFELTRVVQDDGEERLWLRRYGYGVLE